MTTIWTTAGFADNDPWVIETEETKAGPGQKPVLAFDDALALLAASNDGGIGVLVRPADDVSRLAPFAERIALVAVLFPAFNDGRGFSHASLLRDRLGFQGDVRAVGDVLIDQVPLMLRCGFSSFAVTNPVAIRRLGEGRLPGIDLHYQPASKPSDSPGSYAWRRVAAKSA